MISKNRTISASSLSAKSGQSGYTLVELSISLAIISVILVGALTGVQKLIQNNNANNTLVSAQSSLANIMKIVAISNDLNAYEDTPGLGKLGAWEDSYLVKNTSGTVTNIKNPFGGFVHTQRNGAVVGTTPAGSGIWYTITGVPNSACFTTAGSFNNTALAIVVSRPNAAADLKTNYKFNSNTANAPTVYVGGSANSVNPKNAAFNAAEFSGANAPKVDGGALSVNNLETNCSEATNTTKDIHVLVASN